MSKVHCPEADCEERIDKQGLYSHLHHKHGYSYDEAKEIVSNEGARQNLEEYDEELLIDFYRTQRKIRDVEEAVKKLKNRGDVPGSPHLYIGQEAIATGVCQTLAKKDFIGSTWRGHGHLLAKGVEPVPMLLEIAGKQSGQNGGRAGTMHMADLSLGVLGQNGIVGASASHVTGATLAAQMDRKDRVGVAFFSDGALNEGIVPESMNLAAIWDLPVIFVCENNQYAVSTSAEYAVANHESIPERAESLGIPGQTVDGQDVLSVYEAAREGVDRARRGNGPTFMECRTYRYSGHFAAEESMLGDRTYRSKEEEEEWKSRDPVLTFEQRLKDADILSEEELETLNKEIEATIDEAFERIQDSEQASGERALENVYADQDYENLPSEGYR